ncbi:hypothetical protein OG897_24060 [Streptomyces sp. NBC_00237]|uniref:hypothetical protein n=1 Tax=Streptomyces sp. NBC_00237 TaxID=2975687 RepID=UPI002256AFFB|nr:hypothetical protein [Streptomyces sp. NBC_00237]MCX5204518.1 hypothetical protein [Streptomyces sp. NBC_00237]
MRSFVVVVAALCVVAALPGQTLAAGRPGPYVFDEGGKTVRGAASTADAPVLVTGGAYRDRIAPEGKQYYRVNLDAKTNAYVSAVAVPTTGPRVEYADGLKVSVLDRDSRSCDAGDKVIFGSADYPRPLSTYAARLIAPGSRNCQTAGAYYVLVERSTKTVSASEDWELELSFRSEPGLGAAGPTAAPESWPSALPAPPAGGPQKRHGGTGFNDAVGLATGEWRDQIRPGESLFYRVPVDWGQQVFSDIDLHSATGARKGLVADALSFSLFNPARGYVQQTFGSMMYDGHQRTASMDPLPPVAYENRFNSRRNQANMQLAGWYYLRVTLNPKVGRVFGDRAYGTTLRVTVQGTKKPGPAYAGASREFGLAEDRPKAGASGAGSPPVSGSGTMKAVAVGGIGAGTVLVLGLGAWALLARRRTASAPSKAPS